MILDKYLQSRVGARGTLRSAPHRRERKSSASVSAESSLNNRPTAKNLYPKFQNPRTTFKIPKIVATFV